MFSRLSSRSRPITLVVVAGLALAGAGCGSSRSTGLGPRATSTTSAAGSTDATTTTLSTGVDTTAPAPKGVVTSATGEVKTLLTTAKAGTAVSSQGTVAGWAPANGSAIPADPSHISGFGFVPDPAQHNQYLAFAVKDTSGKCAGGQLLANASGTKVTGGKSVAVPAKKPCTGDEVAKLAGHH